MDSEIREVRQNLPRGYYRELPKLAARELAGNARVYALAVELIRHSDSRLDRQQLVRFLDGFQTVAPLTIGELWAWPSMLKLALIENLRRLADETLEARAARRAADAYVARIDAAGKGAPAAAAPRAPRRARGAAPAARPRVRPAPLGGPARPRRAPGRGAGTPPRRRSAASTSARPPTQVSVANVITSLRLCAELDWPQFVESVSLVERVLQRDPAGVHGRMEFLSRDRYRQAVEELAEPTGEAQVRVALRAVESARAGGRGRGAGRARRPRRPPPHREGPPRPGGRRGLAPGPREGAPPPRLRARHRSLYLGVDRRRDRGAGRRGGRLRPAPGRARSGRRSAWRSLLLLPASELAIAVVQRLAARLAPPRRLPRLDFEAGIPEDARTLVVVPTLLTSVAGVEELLEHLEVLALGNLDPRIHFAILGDFTDAAAREMPGRRRHPRRGPRRASRR